MVPEDCPESGTRNTQPHRCCTSPVLYIHIDHLALQPPDYISGALLSGTFRRMTSGRKRKKFCCPLCLSFLISICFATQDNVNSATHRDNPVCIQPSSTVKDINWQRKRTCSQMQFNTILQYKPVHISCYTWSIMYSQSQDDSYPYRLPSINFTIHVVLSLPFFLKPKR